MPIGRHSSGILICLDITSGMSTMKQNKATRTGVQRQSFNPKRNGEVCIRVLYLDELGWKMMRSKTGGQGRRKRQSSDGMWKEPGAGIEQEPSKRHSGQCPSGQNQNGTTLSVLWNLKHRKSHVLNHPTLRQKRPSISAQRSTNAEDLNKIKCQRENFVLEESFQQGGMGISFLSKSQTPPGNPCYLCNAWSSFD